MKRNTSGVKPFGKRGRKESVCVGMVVNTAEKPNRDVMLGIIDYYRERSDFALRFFRASAATSCANLAKFAADGMDGLIFCGVRREIVLEFLRIMPDHPPMVICVYGPLPDEDREMLGNGGQVVCDNVSIGRTAADFFLGHGLVNFAFVGNNIYGERRAADIRNAAFKARVMEVLGRQMSFRSLIMGNMGDNEDFWDDRLWELDRFVSRLKLPCGLFVSGDREAFLLARTCRNLGIEVPGQVEILGVNNSHGLCEVAKPTISSILPDHAATARASVDMVLKLVANPNTPQEDRIRFVSDCALVERGSTLSDRGYGGISVKARDYIRLNACKGISVSDVAESLGVSRRTLETRFLESTGMSVGAAIRDTRLKQLCNLLATTDLPILEITAKAGFSGTSNPGFQFKKVFGMSMRQFRNMHRNLPAAT